MPTRRQRRTNQLLEEELSLLIRGRLDDPRLADVTVTRVETTQDLATAKVYVTRLGQDEDAAEMLAALAHAEPFLRGELSDLGLRRMPHLVFARDTQYESGQRVLEVLASLRAQTEETPGPGDAAPESESKTRGDADLNTHADPDTGRDEPPNHGQAEGA